MVLQHKCPDCGADMNYDADSRLLLCPSCGKTQKIEDMKNTIQDGDNHSHDTNASFDNVDEVYGDYEEFDEQTNFTTYREDEAVHYVCNNCGAELITNIDTTATNCSYCGAPMILGDRLSGKMAPSKVIPFTISKSRAEEAFRKWCKNGLITPSDFMKANQIKSITGIYVPFWLYDVNGRGEAYAKAKKVRHYTSGEYDITETRHYNLYRKVSLNFDHIPADASEKMPDEMMDKLEPFLYKDLTAFNTPYLSGYLAEKYNYTDKELFPRIKQKTFHYIDQYVQNTIHGYSSVTMTERNYDTKQKNSYYTLLPVWMFSYRYNGKDYLFAMNGQTGKVVGKPPISKGKVFLWWAIITLLTFFIASLAFIYVGGGYS